jgi:hypothetical protein
VTTHGTHEPRARIKLRRDAFLKRTSSVPPYRRVAIR